MKRTRKTAVEISSGELCDLLNISHQTLARLKEDGTLSSGKGAMWPMQSSVRAYISHVKNSIKKRRSGYEESKAREKAAKARIAEAEANLREGKLLAVETVAAAESSILTALVTRLCNFGDGIANVCHNQPGEFIAERVNGGLRSALREVAKLPHIPADEKKKTLRKIGYADS